VNARSQPSRASADGVASRAGPERSWRDVRAAFFAILAQRDAVWGDA
jgi:hypothetical protein